MKAKKLLAYLIAASCILGHVSVPVYADEVPASVYAEDTGIPETEKEALAGDSEQIEEAESREGILEDSEAVLEENETTIPEEAEESESQEPEYGDSETVIPEETTGASGEEAEPASPEDTESEEMTSEAAEPESTEAIPGEENENVPMEAEEVLPQEGVLEADVLESNIGTTAATATKITFGQTYSDHWGDGEDMDVHYLTFTTSARGIVNLKAAKPVSNGKYQLLWMVLYNSDGNEIWSSYSLDAVSNAKSYYDVSVGLAAGTYIMAVTSWADNVDTSYRFTFTKNAYTELEPNESKSKATAMTLGKFYTGFYGNDGGNSEYYDYYKFSVASGEPYRIVMSEGIDSLGTTLIDLSTPDGETVTISPWMPDIIDADGNAFYEFIPHAAGTCYLKIYNSVSAQFKYCIKACERPNPVADFVTRLYEVCLGRTPDAEGKRNWVNALESGSTTGVGAASGFVFSQEFKNKNLCNSDYVEALYKAFMGRSSDPAGKASWVSKLEAGVTREEVFNGFALSQEFGKICSSAGIVQGSGIAIPPYGTVPTGNCTVCGQEPGVMTFVKRLYKVCLDREADAAGLNDWCGKLWNHTISGAEAAYGFIFSREFQNKNLCNSHFVDYMYKAFFGRSADAAGKATWVGILDRGSTKGQVFSGFIGSQEFLKLCNKYGITAGVKNYNRENYTQNGTCAVCRQDYKVKFNGNGSTGGSMSTRTYKIGTTYTLPANSFTKTGYVFAGWNTKSDGTGKSYNDRASVKNLTTNSGTTVTLYAQWMKENYYRVVFNGNGSTGGTMASKNYKIGTNYTLPANSFTRTGYLFNGWNTKKDGTGTAYANKAVVKNLTSTQGKTVTLYAQWAAKSKVTVSLNKTSLELYNNGGSSTLKASLNYPNVAVTYTWSSSNTSVATVSSSGKVTAVAPGTATITVKASTGATAKCTVKVWKYWNADVRTLVEYINTNGSVDGDGYHYIRKTYTNGGITYTGTITAGDPYSTTSPNVGIIFEVKASDSTNLTQMGYYMTTGEVMQVVSQQVDSSSRRFYLTSENLDKETFNEDTILDFTGTVTGFTKADAATLANSRFQIGMALWDLMLFENCDMEMYDLGFTSYLQ